MVKMISKALIAASCVTLGTVGLTHAGGLERSGYIDPLRLGQTPDDNLRMIAGRIDLHFPHVENPVEQGLIDLDRTDIGEGHFLAALVQQALFISHASPDNRQLVREDAEPPPEQSQSADDNRHEKEQEDNGPCRFSFPLSA